MTRVRVVMEQIAKSTHRSVFQRLVVVAAEQADKIRISLECGVNAVDRIVGEFDVRIHEQEDPAGSDIRCAIAGCCRPRPNPGFQHGDGGVCRPGRRGRSVAVQHEHDLHGGRRSCDQRNQSPPAVVESA